MILASVCSVLAALFWSGVVVRAPRRLLLRKPAGVRNESVAQAFVPVLEAIATAVAGGAAPAAACAAACAATAGTGSPFDRELLRLADDARSGVDLGESWTAVAAGRDCDGLRAVAACWTLSDRVGCPLTESLEVACALLRSEVGRQSALQVASAGPRASMNLLTALPVVGVLGAAALGADLLSTYLSASGAVTLLPGVGMLLLGRRWSARLIARSTRVTALP
ncbi:type II secretion system F family protein [Calidifontibacter terrae]